MTLSNDSAERISLLYRTAQRNGSLVTIQELSRLLTEDASEQDLVEAVASTPTLNSRFELKGSYLTERQAVRRPDPTFTEMESRRVARINLAHAANFARLLHSNTFEVAAVSGSTSYGSASHSRDLDFFCISRTGHMWISLTKGLLLARAYRTVNRGAPDICFSYIMDESFAESTFESRRDALFARRHRSQGSERERGLRIPPGAGSLDFGLLSRRIPQDCHKRCAEKKHGHLVAEKGPQPIPVLHGGKVPPTKGLNAQRAAHWPREECGPIRRPVGRGPPGVRVQPIRCSKGRLRLSRGCEELGLAAGHGQVPGTT